MQKNSFSTLNLTKSFYQSCFLLLSLSMACALYIPVYPRKIVYTLFYLVVIFLMVQCVRRTTIKDINALYAFFALMFIGLIRIIWSRVFEQSIFVDVVNNYFYAGKLFVISAILCYFFVAWRNYINRKLLVRCGVILFLGLCITFGFALREHIVTGLQIKLLSDSSGTVSYLITTLALTTLYVMQRALLQQSSKVIFSILIFLLNIGMMILTESRAAVMTVPILYLIFFFITHRHVSKFALPGILVLILASFIFMPSSVWLRLDNIQKEISSYNTDNDTSIGARLSIWKGGYHSISWSLLGQSSNDRTAKAREYILAHERGNPEAYKNVMYHLHDDTLETLSLQGILGVISILLFYAVFILLPLILGPYWLVLLPVSLVIFGLTDTVLIQPLSILIITAGLIISSSMLGKLGQKITND